MKENKDIQPIDKLFRQSLEGYSPAPPPSVWKGVKAKLGSGRPSVTQFLANNAGMIIVSSAILGVLAFLIFNAKTSLFPQSENVVSNAKNHTSSAQQVSENNPSKTYQVNSSENPSRVEEPSKAEITPEKRISEKTKNSINQQNKPLAAKPENNTKNPDNPILKPTSLQTQNSKPQAKEEKKYEVSNSMTATSITLASEINASGLNSTTNKHEVIDSQKNKVLVIPEGKTSVALENNKPENPQEAVVTDEKPDFPTNTNPESIDNVAEPKAQTGGMTSTSIKEDKPGTTSPDQGKPASGNSLKSNPLKYSVGVDGSYGKVIIGGLNPNDFYTVDALAGITFTKSKFGIETGIGLGYYKDRGIYNFEFLRTDTTGYIGKSLFNKYDSSYLIVYNPVTSNTTINVDTTTPLSYTYLRIPLYFSKQFFQFNKLNLGLKTGPNLELLITKKETLPEYSLSGTSLVGVQNNSFTMVSTSWQWLFAPQFSWDVTDKIVFRLEPSVIFYLNNRYDSENQPASKPYGIGIWTGLRYNF